MSNRYATNGKRVLKSFLYCTIALTLLGCNGNKNEIGSNMTNHITPTPIVIIGDSEDGDKGDVKNEQTDLNTEISNENEKKQILENLLVSWNFEYGTILLDHVINDLDQKGIHYMGYYNVSNERVDIVLEDKTTLVFLEINYPENDYWERTYRYELMLKGDVFNGNAFGENYLNEYDVTTNEYMFPNLSDMDLDTNMLLNCNQTDLSIARNQLFAKYGRNFSDPFLHAVFSQKDWYDPKINGEEFDKEVGTKLNDLEKTNLAIVLEIEENQYYRKSGSYSTLKSILTGSWLDLDGDGKVEQIKYMKEKTTPNSENDVITVTIMDEGGKVIDTVQREVLNGRDHLYLSAMENGTYQFIIADDGPSADYTMEFYLFHNNSIIDIGTISSYPECARISNNISALVETIHIQCEPIRFNYVIQNKKIRWIEQDFYKYRGNEVVTLVELNLYENNGDRNAVSILNKGDRIKILSGNLIDWVQIQSVTTGEVYWIRVQDGQCFLPNGTKLESSQCFEGLTFYG